MHEIEPRRGHTTVYKPGWERIFPVTKSQARKCEAPGTHAGDTRVDREVHGTAGQEAGATRARRLTLHGLFLLYRHAQLMAHVRAANPEDDVGGDVGGVVSDALEALRDQDAVHRLLGELGLILNELE